MPIEHRYDPALRTLFVELTGEVSETELVDAARKLSADPSIPPGGRELVDLSGVRDTDVTSAVLRRVAQIYSERDQQPEDSRVAIVAPGDLYYGLSRMYEAFRRSSPVEIRVFRELGEAREVPGDLGRQHLGRGALARADGAVDEAVQHRRRLRAGPVDAADRARAAGARLRQHAGRVVRHEAAARPLLAGELLLDVVARRAALRPEARGHRRRAPCGAARRRERGRALARAAGRRTW